MKNKMAKIAFIILSIVFVFSACMTVFAVTFKSVTESQNGIEATLNFNKQEYNANENVEVTLNVKNNNSYAVKNIQTELIVPSKIKLATGSLKQETFSLNAGESKVQEVALEKVVETSNEPTTNSPQTGDNVVVYISMMTISAVALVFIAVKKKWIHKKKVMSLVLCFILIGTMTLTSVVNANVAVKEFTVEGTIKYDGEDVVIKGKVTYDYEVYSKVQIDGVDKGMYADGNTVNITAEDAPEGKHFAGWTVVKGNVTLADANSSTTTFVMGKEDVEIKSNYEVNTYTIDVTLGENGRVTPEGKISVKHGESKQVTITANEGYHIENLESSGKKYQNTLGNKWKSFTIDYNNVGGNYYVKADFTIDTFTITSSANEGGTITETATVNYGGSKTFTITPNKNYHIEKVEVDGQDKGTNDTYTFTDVKDNHTINATFAINPYSITATAGANGTITESARLNYGDSKTFTFYPNTGYSVYDVKVDGVSIDPVSSYTFENVRENHTISVTYRMHKKVSSSQSLREAINDESSVLAFEKDITQTGADIRVGYNLFIDCSGHALNNALGGTGQFQLVGGTLTFFNGRLNYLPVWGPSCAVISEAFVDTINLSDDSSLIFSSGSISEIYVDSGSNFVKIYISGGVLRNLYVSGNCYIEISGGKFYFDPTSYLDADKYKATKTKDADNIDIWVVTKK